MLNHAIMSAAPRGRDSADLGVGLSTLSKWIKALGEEEIILGPDQDLARENAPFVSCYIKELWVALNKPAPLWHAGTTAWLGIRR